jgi:hypothetical protein
MTTMEKTVKPAIFGNICGTMDPYISRKRTHPDGCSFTINGSSLL